MTLVPARVARSVMHSPTCNPQDDSGFRVMSLVWSVAISFLVLLSFALSNAPAQTTELAIYEEEPFDRITLDAANKNAVIEVFPVDFPDGKIPESPPADAQLRIRLLSRPAEQYDVAWGAIAKYETFPDVVLDEANKLVGQKQFDEAYRCFAWLQREYPEIAGLDAAVGNFVLQDAADAYRDGRWDEAVTLLEEVARRTPNLPGIQRNLAAVTEKLVSQFLKERKFRAVRHFATRYAENTRADELQASAKRWSDLLQKLAEQRRAAAEKYLEQGDLRKAHEATRELLDIWPDLPGAQQLSGTLTQRYPLVTIAVSSFGRPDPLAIDEWTSRRDGRLQWRSLVEFAGYSADGSRYECPLGELTVRDDLRGLTIQLRESDSSLSHINGFDISRRLLWMADASRPEYSPFWSRVAGAISVTDVFNIHVELRHPSLRPEALLQPTLRVAELEDVPSIAPYLQESVDRRMKRFVLNPDYAFGNSTMPAEVVQKLVPDARQAIAALERREVDMIDRLYPADVARLKAKNHLVV
ncbi:MAG: hypothetical protein KDA99_08990, partial [Planctomycetales bacterium]|nr:hypothetical protein [Planctomycetales bacterium]